ncbi:expressed unknown protein [Seminavis robusta]|uniref:Uncharacterized protein n=1 Tax=Seminavis robusta TaxID=568900 RepID=A0A9N8E5D2_9STRA|nr:expressed unknown protein [Seminavis robusta]|eukprot:Sro535_g161890.1 n/a (138) ;mRNA; r:6358-6771
MGLLKHGILPLLGLLHAVMTLVAISGNMGKGMVDAGVVPPDHEFSAFEEHLLNVVGMLHGIMLIGCTMGVLAEDAHYRGIVICQETIMFCTIAYSDFVRGYTLTVSASLAVLTSLGTIVHFMEPGIFTSDKAKTKPS